MLSTNVTATDTLNACGCGEEQIPWMLAKFGLLGAASLVLAVLVVMTLAGWGLAWAVWLVRSRGRGRGRGGSEETAASAGLAGFRWREDQRED
ncbi:hypothetical protein SGFS_047130 [Streptomyces graminofaciens]|jgi:hypothetical protein|uniref:Uncharacterized protein n=1 Tax=Streptomyces graminofaciens TaxID=68212 RepID=A0ABM7FAU5_9ACTN|nr:hypothetical protein [Streptomyces graminofaciens]BBC33419.1 hypothetical protein SGFS_047130 [Streptomyces graminofaciens]